MTGLKDLRRERGWSQSQVITALTAQARAAGFAVPGAESIRVMLSRWENGRVRPDEPYRGYLRAVFACTDGELDPPGARPSPGLSPSVLAIPTFALPDRVTPQLLDYLAVSLQQYVVADNLLGAGPLLSVVAVQGDLVDFLVASAATDTRRQVLSLGCRYAEFRGWLHQDAGDPAGAQRWSDRALAYALELGDEVQVAYVMMRKSNIATDAGQPHQALGLADAALRRCEVLPARLRAVALRQQAIASAAAGEVRRTALALDQANEAVTDGVDHDSAPEDEMFSYCTSAYLASEAGQCWLRLGQPAKAVQVLDEGLRLWPDHRQRDRGLMLARLARAHVASGEWDGALPVLREAVELAGVTASGRTLAELRALSGGLPTGPSAAARSAAELLRTL